MCIHIVLDTCCGCADLKTGCFVIGYSGLTITGMAILSIVYTLFIATDGIAADHSFSGDFIRILLYICLVICILHFLFSSCLVYGTHKNGRGWIKAFIVYINILIGYEIIQLILLIFSLNFLGLLVNIPMLLFLCYIVGVVDSYHKQLGLATNPVNYAAGNTGVVISPATVPYTAPNSVYPVAVTGQVGYVPPNDVYNTNVTSPVGYGSPNDVYNATVTGPIGYSATNGQSNYGAPNSEYTASAPVNYSHNLHTVTKM